MAFFEDIKMHLGCIGSIWDVSQMHFLATFWMHLGAFQNPFDMPLECVFTFWRAITGPK